MYRILFFLFFISFSFAQQTDKVDFIKCNASVSPHASEKSIYGDVIYEFKVKKMTDTIKIDARNMEFSGVMINGKSVDELIEKRKEQTNFQLFCKTQTNTLFYRRR